MKLRTPAVDACRTLPDEAVVARVRAGEPDLFELLMRRHNQRLFHVVRSIVPNDAEAEDALQQAYLSAFQHLGSFEGRARVSTWLTRIAIREANRRRAELARRAPAEALPDPRARRDEQPDARAAARELHELVEDAIDGLPETYRTVLLMRAVDGIPTREVADCLEVSEDVVRIRLFRARRSLRHSLSPRLDQELASAFAFAGERCARIVAGVLARVGPRRP